jgi:hypothetical protein
VAVIHGADDQARHGTDLAERVAQLAGHGQGAAAGCGRLRDRPTVAKVPEDIDDRGAPLQHLGHVGRVERGLGEQVLRGAPPVTARLGPPGQLA